MYKNKPVIFPAARQGAQSVPRNSMQRQFAPKIDAFEQSRNQRIL